MYYSKDDLERIRKEGAEIAKKEELERQKSMIGSKYKANEIQVICVHCKYDKFELNNILLNTRGMTYFGFDWLNDSADTLICKGCGYIHWFAKKVTEIEE